MSDYIERNCAKCNSLLHHEDKCPSPCKGGAGDHCGIYDCLKCDRAEALGKLLDAMMLLKRTQHVLASVGHDHTDLFIEIVEFLDNKNARR